MLKPDPARLEPLMNLPTPTCSKSLKQIIGMFSYYAKWIKSFSDKIKVLNLVTNFPLNTNEIKMFELLKSELAHAAMQAIDENIPFTVETDASDFAISATLNQDGRPVAFHSRTLQGSEQFHSSVEKEAQAIVEAIHHWRHFLLGRHFSLITDQRSVAYMYDYKSSSKIKNDKIMRWRVALSPYSYDIHYRPGSCNSAPDTFTRVRCAAISSESLYDLHAALCHAGITRLLHFIRSKNLPYSVDNIKQICRDCRICQEVKPKYYQPPKSNLIKATQPFERISIDFKGPIPSTNNQYMLTIVDEYSRFPFAYPVKDVSTNTVIKCLRNLFSIFGLPNYIHSDRGTAFMSNELKQWLVTKGISTSRTTPYNPTGNGQVERYNGIIWKSILLAIKTRNLPISQWEKVLPDALHSVRSLLCTATNCSPHERLFKFSRRSTTGQSLPTWLMTPGPVLMRRNVRQSKYEPLVDEVQLIEANTQYAHVRMKDGRETTVSTKQLAPAGSDQINPMHEPDIPNLNTEVSISDDSSHNKATPVSESDTDNTLNRTLNEGDNTLNISLNENPIHDSPVLRRSERIRKPPEKLDI